MTINKEASNLLFTKVQQRILKLLYLNTEIDFNTNQIIKLTESGTGAVQRELQKFTSAGLINCRKMGNQKRYQANQALPYFSELKSIIIKTFGLAEILKEALNSKSNQLIIAFIYGSFAKQTDTATSDIDILLIGKDVTYSDVFHIFKNAEELLDRKVNPSIYSPDEWIRKYREENNFVRKVIEQPKIFLIGSENEFKKLR